MKLKVVELFAGVGGFRLGLSEEEYEIVWSNQWEPPKGKSGKGPQHASEIYKKRFGKDNHSCEDIANVDIDNIPNHDVLVGGFPCQDYSVASLLKNSKGVLGKKGVLWWQIHRILRDKKEEKPKYLILENVDRLLKSPASQRGRDFAIMLHSLSELGYAVEWRVINAADYGFPQKRRRVFILGYQKGTDLYSEIENDPLGWIKSDGIFAKAFQLKIENKKTKNKKNNDQQSEFQVKLPENLILKGDSKEITDNFNKENVQNIFKNTGVMFEGKVWTEKTVPKDYKNKNLKDIIENKKVASEFYISDKSIEKWEYEKGAKKKTRVKDGFTYEWAEGKIPFPDRLDSPSRTIITTEGGSSPSRIKHVIKDKYGLRRLTPIELEKLNGFPKNHTKLDGVTDNMRAFLMGNALVVGVVKKIGNELVKRAKL